MILKIIHYCLFDWKPLLAEIKNISLHGDCITWSKKSESGMRVTGMKTG